MIVRVNENEDDEIIGQERESAAKARLFTAKDVKECAWEEPYLEVTDHRHPLPPTPVSVHALPRARHRARPQRHNA